MLEKGHAVNPCNSPLHPAVSEAGILPDSSQPELCLQEAYTPESTCWGCGPAAEDGLHLRSKRVENGLEARVILDAKYASFPGVINGGVVATLVDCLSNWTAATHLMDTSALLVGFFFFAAPKRKDAAPPLRTEKQNKNCDLSPALSSHPTTKNNNQNTKTAPNPRSR
jgi:hypothetical protein